MSSFDGLLSVLLVLHLHVVSLFSRFEKVLFDVKSHPVPHCVLRSKQTSYNFKSLVLLLRTAVCAKECKDGTVGVQTGM